MLKEQQAKVCMGALPALFLGICLSFSVKKGNVLLGWDTR